MTSYRSGASGTGRGCSDGFEIDTFEFPSLKLVYLPNFMSSAFTVHEIYILMTSYGRWAGGASLVPPPRCSGTLPGPWRWGTTLGALGNPSWGPGEGKVIFLNFTSSEELADLRQSKGGGARGGSSKYPKWPPNDNRHVITYKMATEF